MVSLPNYDVQLISVFNDYYVHDWDYLPYPVCVITFLVHMLNYNTDYSIDGKTHLDKSGKSQSINCLLYLECYC